MKSGSVCIMDEITHRGGVSTKILGGAYLFN